MMTLDEMLEGLRLIKERVTTLVQERDTWKRLAQEQALRDAHATLVARRPGCDGCIQAAAYITFIAGRDIPETLEKARAALVLRAERAEAERDEAQKCAVEMTLKACAAEQRAAEAEWACNAGARS